MDWWIFFLMFSSLWMSLDEAFLSISWHGKSWNGRSESETQLSSTGDGPGITASIPESDKKAAEKWHLGKALAKPRSSHQDSLCFCVARKCGEDIG